MTLRQGRSDVPDRGHDPDPGHSLSGVIAFHVENRHRHLERTALVVLGVLAGVCLIATITRMSPVPLVPLLPFGLAVFPIRFAATAAHAETRLWWWGGFAATTAIGFWLMSWVGRFLAAS